MRRLGLTHAELKAYNRGLCFTHERRIEVQILTLEERVIRSLTPVFIDGEVTIDVTRTPSRRLDMTFLDPTRTLSWDADDPGEAPLNRSRMIRVIDRRLVPGLDFWVDCAVFTGPCIDFERNGAEVHVVAEGKEAQAMGHRWKAKQFRKKTRKIKLIRTLLEDTGERNMRLPNLRATLPKRVTVARLDRPWEVAENVGESMDRHLFYDGSGTLRLRRHPGKSCLTIKDALLSPLTVKNTKGGPNTILVRGGNPKGPKKRVQASATVAGRHPNSPRTLGRHGEPFREVEERENRNLKSKVECKKRANRIRDDRARMRTKYEFEMLPFPHLDEMDLVAVEDPGGTVLARMRQWTIPVSTDAAPMPVGTLRRTKPARAGRGNVRTGRGSR